MKKYKFSRSQWDYHDDANSYRYRANYANDKGEWIVEVECRWSSLQKAGSRFFLYHGVSFYELEDRVMQAVLEKENGESFIYGDYPAAHKHI